MYPPINKILSEFDEKSHIYTVESETSKTTLWSCNLDSINSSIKDLQRILEKQDGHVIDLKNENEMLKNDLKSAERELIKHKYLLETTRELFEQHKRYTANYMQKSKSEEIHLKPTDNCGEILKMKSELKHYKRLSAQHNHDINRLSKVNNNLRACNIQLKSKFIQHEKQYNKLIYEMTVRFDISRSDVKRIIESKKFVIKQIPETSLDLLKITDRNTRLAHDNYLLKFKVNDLERSLELVADKNQIQSLMQGSEIFYSPIKSLKNNIGNVYKDDYKVNVLKAVPSELSCATLESNVDIKLEMKSSVTNLVHANKSYLEKTRELHDNISTVTDNVRIGSEESIIRTESAPQLTIVPDKCLGPP